MGEEEEEEVSVTALHHPNSGNDDQSLEFDIYPLSSYYFGSKDAVPSKDLTLVDRVLRMKSKFGFFLLLSVYFYCNLISLFVLFF